MRKSSLYFLLILTTFALLSSCKKYVEVNPKGQLIPKETINFRYILNSSANFLNAYGHNEFSIDDVDLNSSQLLDRLQGFEKRMYLWDKALFIQQDNDFEWNNLYAQIYNANIVIHGVEASTGGTAQEKGQALGEALVHRAFAYWVLVTQYSKLYNAATAATDAGVPLVLEPLDQPDLTRVSVQRIYGQLFEDLNKALPLLKGVSSNNLFPSKCAAYALMSRAYLFMSKYPEALAAANQALAIKSEILDLRTFEVDPETLPPGRLNPEILLAKNTPRSPYTPYRLSDEFVALFDQENDLRYQLYTADGNQGSFPRYEGRKSIKTSRQNESGYVGLSIPEVYLIKAECEARTNDLPAAMATLNSLLLKRFKAGTYVDKHISDKQLALDVILTERRKELFDNGMRWFDLRRLNLEPAFAKTLQRNVDGSTYTLAPGSNRYIYQIAPSLIERNPEITQNPRD